MIARQADELGRQLENLESEIGAVKRRLEELSHAALIENDVVYREIQVTVIAPRKTVGRGRWTSSIPLVIVESE